MTPPSTKSIAEPVEPERLLDNPDPDWIEATAVWHLARALNIGRVIAFVGAGVPMAYGRISWRGLVEMLAKQVSLRCAELVNGIETKLSQSEKDLLNDLNSRVETMEKADAGADQYPTLFQLTEQLDKMLKNIARKYYEESGDYGELRQNLAANVYDDRGQGKELFRRAFLQNHKLALSQQAKRALKQNEKLKTFLDEHFQPDGAYDTTRAALDERHTGARPCGYAHLFTHGRTTAAARDARRAHRSHKVRSVIDALEAVAGGKATSQLPAIHRFASVCLLRLALANNALLPKPAPTAANTPRERFPSRSDLVQEARDPLLILSNGLRIHRFLTTNYDLDIERLFRDLGYVERPNGGRSRQDSDDHKSPGTDRLDSLGGRSRDLVVTPHEHGRLLDFATQDRPPRVQVVHLHGRATLGDKDSIVVTERDYQSLYQREGADRQPMDVARRVTFGGNPLLFVGLGLGEDDILRPLRQFMGQESRLGDRLAVAIMPGLKLRQARLLEQMTLLNRYGVYGIYYGAATLKGSGSIDEEGDDWLARVFDVADAVSKVARATAERRIEAWSELIDKWFKLDKADANDPRKCISSRAVPSGSRYVLTRWMSHLPTSI